MHSVKINLAKTKSALKTYIVNDGKFRPTVQLNGMQVRQLATLDSSLRAGRSPERIMLDITNFLANSDKFKIGKQLAEELGAFFEGGSGNGYSLTISVSGSTAKLYAGYCFEDAAGLCFNELMRTKGTNAETKRLIIRAAENYDSYEGRSEKGAELYEKASILEEVPLLKWGLLNKAVVFYLNKGKRSLTLDGLPETNTAIAAFERAYELSPDHIQKAEIRKLMHAIKEAEYLLSRLLRREDKKA